MPRLQTTTHIGAPSQRVFELCADLPHAPQYISAITRIEVLTDGPIGKGTRFRETRVICKREATETMEITAFDPPHGYTIELESCGARFRTDFRFIGEGPDRTRVELEMTIKAVTFLAKLMSPLSLLMMGAMRKCVEQDLADVKRAAEGSAVPRGEESSVVPTGQSS